MKTILAVLILVLVAMIPNNASAEVRFTSRNHAVFGGKIRVEGATKCLARFSNGAEKHYDQLKGSRPWFEATAVLPCDLSNGGRIVVEVNGKPTGFQIPAGLIKHGTESYVAVGDIPFIDIPIHFAGKVGEGIIDIEVYPQARNIRCKLRAHTDWPYDRGYEGSIAYKKAYIEEFLARHPLLCDVN